MQIGESTLTGEATTVEKRADIVLDEELDFGERQNLVFQSTEVVQGRGKAIVTKTGMGHAISLSARRFPIAIRSSTRLAIEMNPLSNPYVWGAVILTTVLPVANRKAVSF